MGKLEARAQLIRVAALAIALAGCGDPQLPEACARAPEFAYEPSYTELAGTCGPYAGYVVAVDRELSATISIYGDTLVDSRGDVVECTFRLEQVVQEGDVVTERVTGELQIHEDGLIEGEAMLQRFDRRRETTCSGEYDVVLTRRGSANQ